MKELEEIIGKHLSKLPASKKFQLIGLGEDFDNACFEAMKEAYNLALDKAAENCTKLESEDYYIDGMKCIDKSGILNLKLK